MYNNILGYFKQRIGNFQFCKSFSKTLCSNNRGEFVNREMEAYLRHAGIHHETTAAYTPKQNGMAERMNQTV
jgi:transposase InsO family protein